MTVRMRQGEPLAVDAAKAAAIARDGGCTTFTGSGRRLRKLRDLLASRDDLTVFLGSDDRETCLWVGPPSGAGWYRERV
jgi:hypothetical protein